tara:strand:- start:306 stop:629 length:324 start_codon:yes stop_codon:yes gene_type:complete
MINSLLPEIHKHLESHYPKEACGLITEDLKWFPITNVSEYADQFEMDSTEFIKVAISNKIRAVVHSHIDTSPKPSKIDIKQCNGLNLDYYIINLPDKKLYHLKPNRK